MPDLRGAAGGAGRAALLTGGPIRRSDRIRNKVRRVDFDTVTFEFGSAVLPDDQIPQMLEGGRSDARDARPGSLEPGLP